MQQEKRKQVYISGALTNSNKKDFYEAIGKTVNSLGYQAYIPHLHTDPEKNANVTAEDVYKIDMEQIENSFLVIAYVGLPSLGVGAELERANANRIPVILLHEAGSMVSRLIRGIPCVKGELQYDSEDAALIWISKMIIHSAP